MKQKTIKKSLLFSMIGLVSCICVLCGAANAFLLRSEAISDMNTRLNESATAYNQSVQHAIQTYKANIEAIARDTEITAPGLTEAQRQSKLDALAQKYGFESVVIADANGNTSEGTNISDRDYFQKVLSGQTYISSPLIGKLSQKLEMNVLAKVDNGTSYDGIVYGRLSSDTFSKMISNVAVGQSGYGFITDKGGKIIAHKNQAVVAAMTNYIDVAKKDSAYADQSAVVKNMIAGKTGIQSCKFKGVDMSVSYQKIPDTDGWSIAILANESDMLGGFYQGITVTCILTVLFILAAAFIAVRLAKPIADPIVSLVARIEKLADGDLHTGVPQVNSTNEIGVLSKSFTKTVDTLNGYVGEISDVLSSLKAGDCTVEAKQDYRGDFAPIKDSLEGITDDLNRIYTEIRIGADQVSGGAEQVSNAAQSLSQGATEQASSIEELSASITEINTKVANSAANASEANRLSTEASQEMELGREQMEKMVAAMGDISDSSAKIKNIIKTIQDIAFQTNILSLNAAVEAARAGEAGKGFSVVADEVRNLAGKSAEAAKDTSELIESSLAAVRNGSKIAEDTQKSFRTILESSEKTNALIESISADANEQASAIGQVTQGVEQISAVVQTNSATSEESAAASEELNGQAQAMKQTLAFLKLKEN